MNDPLLFVIGAAIVTSAFAHLVFRASIRTLMFVSALDRAASGILELREQLELRARAGDGVIIACVNFPHLIAVRTSTASTRMRFLGQPGALSELDALLVEIQEEIDSSRNRHPDTVPGQFFVEEELEALELLSNRGDAWVSRILRIRPNWWAIVFGFSRS